VGVPQTTAYEEWMQAEGIPIVEAMGGIEDVKEIERRPWARTGGKGAFIYLKGMKEGGFTGMYILEIPPGKALEPEKHLYEENVYVLRGQGAAEIWQDGGPRKTLEWGEGSLFSPPLNTSHRLYNGGREPVLLLGVTTAPIVIDLFHDLDFVFGDGFAFKSRYAGEDDYFKLDRRVERGGGKASVWETNFIADLKNAFFEVPPSVAEGSIKVAGGNNTIFEMSENVLSGHISEWPVGMYHKAHYHGPGAILLGLRSEGYVLLWPKEAGTTPYRSGCGEKVIKIPWKEGSVYSPGDGWFHQHFNTGPEPARHIAFRTGGTKYKLGLRPVERAAQEEMGVIIDIKKGGTMIEYEDEDAQIRRDFEASLREAGVTCRMPPVRKGTA
jgi:mannose-6-phosphate isomerase-like protein (cupin superfamily)